jgi:hypothetical protein
MRNASRRSRRDRSRHTRRRPSPSQSSGVLNRFLGALERPGRVWAALGVAIGLTWLTLQRVPIGVRPTYLGKSYAQLAANPFDPDPSNPVALRILAPLVSYLIGLRGAHILYANLIWVIVMLAGVYLWFRAGRHEPWLALVGTSTMAFSMVVLTSLHYGGYPDVFTYLLVFLAYWTSASPWLSCLLFLLALLSHDGAAFLAPWLLVVIARRQAPDATRWLRATAGIVATLVVFAGMRWLLQRAHPLAEYSVRFYLDPLLKDPLSWFRASEKYRWLGVLSAFNLFWVFPLLAAFWKLRRKERADAAMLLLPIPLVLAQLFVAFDVTRLTTLAFMAVLLGVAELLRTNAFAARRWVPWLIVANFFIPQVNVAMGVLDPMRRE